MLARSLRANAQTIERSIHVQPSDAKTENSGLVE